MESDNPMLLESQSRVQELMQSAIARLVADAHSPDEWDSEISAVRFVSEQTWVRCNAFLFAYTAARFAVAMSPGLEHDSRGGDFTFRFVSAVASGEATRALEVWTDASAVGEKVGGPQDQTRLVEAITSALRAPVAGIQPAAPTVELPAPFPGEVWFDASAGSGGDVT